ncbi:MAG TPA: hypothetical protein VGM30_14895 [Puia sp.]|jgi:hypothetical protein
MKYVEFERLISPQRLNRYNAACNNNTRKTLSLYRANIRMSQAFLAVLGIFEVVLRNKIDQHYKAQFTAAPEWLLASTLPGGFLTRNGCQNSLNKISRTYTDLGANYTHDKLLAELSFGFWKFMFAGRQFQAGGSTLLAILPSLPAHRNQNFIYQKLDRINSIRNRVAHHEPICFGPGNAIGTIYARSHFQEITDIITYMGVNSQQLLFGIDGVIKEANYIDGI